VDELMTQNPPNLFFLINSLTKGGAERQVITLQKTLGGKIILLENSVQYEEVASKDIHALNESLSNSLLRKGAQYFTSIFRLVSILRADKGKDKPVVISFLERSNILNLITSIFAGQKVILSVRINLDIQYKSAPLFRLFARYFYRYADLVTTNSQGMRQLLVDNYCITQEKAVYVPNAYEIDLIRTRSFEPLQDHELEKLASESQYLLSVNRLDEQKLIKAQIELYAKLKSSNPEVKLFIVGDGPLRNDLILFAESLNLHVFNVWDNSAAKFSSLFDVYFLGLIDNPYRLYRMSKCLILTSQYESLPNVIIEGLICDSTILAADCRFGPREILSSETDYQKRFDSRFGLNDCGVLLPVPIEIEDIALWSDYLIKVFNNKLDLTYKESLSHRVENYSKENVLRAWISLIEN
jgi:glycosyltransferase involved in cell wall biosynthesis